MKLELLAVFCAAAMFAQPGPNSPVFPGNPPGGIGATCPQTPIGYLTAAGQYVSCVAGLWTVSGSGSGVTSFNTRTGAVSLTSADVTTALTYTPINQAGDTMTGALSLGAFPVIERYTTGTGGVTANHLVKLDTNGTVIAVTGTEGIFGIAKTTASATNPVDVVMLGPGSCVAEGTITAGDFLIAGTTDPTACKDSGQSTLNAIAPSSRVIAKAAAAATNGQTFNVTVIGQFRFGSNAFTGPASSTSGNLVSFNGTSGQVGQDSGIAASNVALLNGSAFTGQVTSSFNSAASTPVVKFTGTLFTGGSGTTTMPFVYIDPAGTSSTAWNTAGTLLGGNAPSGFTGNLLDLQVNGSSAFAASSGSMYSGTSASTRFFLANVLGISLTSAGIYGFGAGSGDAGGAKDTGISRDAAGVIDFGTGAQGSTAGTWKTTKGLWLNPVAVGSLPACASGTLGQRQEVNDATVATPGSAAVGSGTFTIAVQCTFNSSGSVYTWIID